MSYGATPSVHSRAINALFDTTAAAKGAIDDLVAAGIPREHISNVGTDTGAAHKTIWDTIKDAFLPEADRSGYEEGLRRGGTLVTVQADEANYNRVLDILDRDGAVNMDERETSWRHEGWSGAHNNDTILGFGATGAMIGDPAAVDPVAADAVTLSVPVGPAYGSAGSARVARRDADSDRPRARSYRFEGSAGDMPLTAAHDLGPADDLRAPAVANNNAATFAGQIVPHMEVIAVDGEKIGEVDRLDGLDRIKLAKSASPDGEHHIVPFAWIDRIDRRIHLKKTVAEILDAR